MTTESTDQNITVRTKIHRWRLLYTIVLFVGHFSYAMCGILVGSIPVELALHYQVPFSRLIKMNTCFSVGYLCGSIIGWIYRWVNRQLLIIVILFLMGLAAILFPHYRFVELLFLGTLIFGFGSGAWDCTQSVWLVEVWQYYPKAVNSLLQAIQFAYGCGTIVAPVIWASFLPDDQTNITPERRSQSLSALFGICGSFLVFVSALFLLLHLFKPYKSSDFMANVSVSSDQCGPENSTLEVEQIKHRKLKLLITGFALALYGCAENLFFNYSTAMLQYSKIGLSAKKAAHVLALFTGAYTAGRFANTFISILFIPDIILAYHYLILVFSIVVLYGFLGNYTVVLITNLSIGYGCSVFWPSYVAFTERNFRFTSKISSFYSALYSVMYMWIPFILGEIFETHPTIFFVVEASFLLPSLVIFIGLNIFLKTI